MCSALGRAPRTELCTSPGDGGELRGQALLDLGHIKHVKGSVRAPVAHVSHAVGGTRALVAAAGRRRVLPTQLNDCLPPPPCLPWCQCSQSKFSRNEVPPFYEFVEQEDSMRASMRTSMSSSRGRTSAGRSSFFG